MPRYRATFEFEAYDRLDAAHWVRWVLEHYARDGTCDIEKLERVPTWESSSKENSRER